ncbi:MAG: aminoacyl-tRNA hydrolase [Alphaproteobacteria bacterium]|nr:aminoacyl-tRNA hydrolase [Alphaproteobacteria bacterium]
MLLLVGLGNPGPKYQGNRHNVGFMAVDAIARRYSFAPWRARFEGLVAEGTIDGEKVLALKPQTYMNESGRSVGAAMRFYKLAGKDVAVIHDELDLKPFKVRVKTGGGAAGHNGIRSIDAHVGPEYRRVRFGIGHPGDKALVLHHALGDFLKEEQADVKKTIDAIVEAAPLLARGDDNAFMTRVAVLTQPPREPKPPKPPTPKKED